VIDISELLPHRGQARLIERVVTWNETDIEVRTATHRSLDNPLRHEGRLAGVHLIEYGAQAMALHGALLRVAAGGQPKSALLVSARNFAMRRDFIDTLGGELTITAQLQLATESSWQYSFEVTHEGEVIASGRVAAMAHALPGS
jgi:predicted hotdog family 3-hydroxylacyl-ACP dehydratase